jgi:hypothetical protein
MMSMKEQSNMDRNFLKARPKRREEGLIVREVGDEVIVYDLDRHEAHCLNPEAAEIWNACDGVRDGRAILLEIRGKETTEDHETAYLIGLGELRRNRLLEGERHGSGTGVPADTNRRELLARLGKAAAVTVALPAVMSIVSPTPAEAASCIASGDPCSSSSQCCSGLCLPSGTCA